MMQVKKIILSIALFGIVSFAFSRNFFSERFFEIQTSIPFDFSNNVFSFNDMLKEEVVIDLKEVADSMTKDGLVLVARARPEIGFNLNIGFVSVGSHFGLDIYEKMGISKDLFDFLGKGNEIGEEINVEFKNNTDVFFVGDCNIGIKGKKFSITVTPSVFVPIISVDGSILKASFLNNEDGEVIMNLNSNANVYMNVGSFEFSEDFFKDGLESGGGLDLGGSVSIPFGKKLTISADARVPIVPGSYKYYVPNISVEKGIKMNVSDFVNNSGDLDSMITETGDESFVPDFSDINIETLPEKKYIHRPMKIHAYASYAPLLGLIEFCGGGGVGIYHPFMDDSFMYPEYYFSAGVNLLNLIKAKLSTEYTDQIYKHQVSASVNVRLLEIECGVSLQSTTFTRSMEATGLGGYVIVSIGF